MRKFVIFIISLLILILYQCGKINKLESNQSQNIAAISDSVEYYRNRLNSQTATVKTLQLENYQIKDIVFKKDKALTALANEFKKINAITKYKSDIAIDTIRIHFKDSVPCVFNYHGKKMGESFSFNYRATQKGIEIDSLLLQTQTTIITGIKKKWLFGPQVLTTDVTNSNPYIKVTSLESAEITVKQPWYKKWYVWLTAGTLCGWLTAK